MCGISALVNRNDQPVSRALLQNLNEKAIHRGPDGEGVFIENNVGLAHRRLAIIDLTSCGAQPMEKLDNIITYNGEIYNFVQLRKQLEMAGYTFHSRSDTEVILAAYDYWKEDCLSRFEGMWSLVIYDRKRERLFCSRDRFGQKPFHYAIIDNYFVVASEIKQIAALPGFRATWQPQVAFHFLNHGALNYSAETFFEGVHSLPAGHQLVYDLRTHSYTIRQWYEFKDNPVPKKISFPEAAAEFRRLFEQSVVARLQSDVNLGASLSGGLDSSAVCCVMQRLNGKTSHKSISVCWDDPQIDEQPYTDAIISTTGNDSVKVFPDINELHTNCALSRIIYAQDQPILSASYFAEFKLYEAAQTEGLTVMLDGHGADEYLGGYTAFNFYYLHGLLSSANLQHFYRQWKKIALMHTMPLSLFIRNCIELRYKYLFPGIKPFLNQRWAKNYLEKDPALLSSSYDLKHFTLHQLFVCSLPSQVHSADRNSMHHSIEARMPFLDHRLVEFVYNLPDTQKIRDGFSKAILRQALGDVLPEKVKNRQNKLGFPAPEVSWMRRNAAWVNQEITESMANFPGIFNEQYIKSLLASFTKSLPSDYSVLFRLISLNRWAKVFNVSLRSFSWLPLLITA
ncbi:MAG TPA: asparagine synthase (glutamine-hydrolyzing) [Chitinophagaceae bacterium]|nr:asparagine synthase (glutamine-hydrolyzing) [Chitinophagaceae bacterium]